MHSVLALGLLAVAGLSSAQQVYQIDPTTVPKATRDQWCIQEKSQCPLICLQQPGVKTQNTVSNDCDADNLTYKCVCDNNVAPNVTQYTQTLPYFICTEWGNQCVKACGTDNTCSSKCRADHPCGAQDPFKPNTTATSTASSKAASATAATTVVPTVGFAGVTTTAKAGAALATFDMSASYTIGLSVAMALAGFALL